MLPLFAPSGSGSFISAAFSIELTVVSQGPNSPFLIAFCGISKAKASPEPTSTTTFQNAAGNGDMFIRSDPATKNKITFYNATLNLRDNIAGALGYTEVVQDPPKPEVLQLDSIKPGIAPTEYAWQPADGTIGDSDDLTAARKRCEAVVGYGNCEPRGNSYWSKAPEQRTFPKPYERS
jgi:hypothetical protein